jgi:hypothetical protein
MNNVPMRIEWESELNTKAQVEGMILPLSPMAGHL